MSFISYQIPRVALAGLAPSARHSSLQNEIERLFDLGLNAPRLNPGLDLHQTGDTFTATVELPGLKREDFAVTLHDGDLIISGERRSEKAHDEQRTLLNERAFGKFERRVTLPAEVDASRVTATYEDGILTVSLPKAEAAKPRQIEVK